MSEPLKVECYAGSCYPERPRAVEWQGKRLLIESIEAQWRTPQGLFFRVCTADGIRLQLTYLAGQDCWQGKAS